MNRSRSEEGLARKVRQSELACILDEGIRILDFHQLATHRMRDPGTAKRPKVTRIFGPSLALEVRLSRIRMMIAPSYRKTRSSVAAWPGGAKPTEDRRRIVIAVEDDTPCKTTSEDTLGENAQTKRRKAVISRNKMTSAPSGESAILCDPNASCFWLSMIRCWGYSIQSPTCFVARAR